MYKVQFEKIHKNIKIQVKQKEACENDWEPL